jgi:hypothetical protein
MIFSESPTGRQLFEMDAAAESTNIVDGSSEDCSAHDAAEALQGTVKIL